MSTILETIATSARAAPRSAMVSGAVALFAPKASVRLGELIVDALGIKLDSQEEREFEDGEHKARPLEPVRARIGRKAHAERRRHR